MLEALKEQLLILAKSNGASSVGVAGVEPFEDVRIAMQNRRRSGMAGPLHFTYDDPALATAPRESFPWAKRLVVVGATYVGEAATASDRGAIVGRFATRDEYTRIRRITDVLVEELGAHGYRAEAISDDNRLVDRAAAVRAGVGWWGKSTMVLAPGQGPWMLLGSVITDAELPISDQMARTCGTCVACYPACPTGALSDDGLDARRCLSTWLQAKGSIPHWIRPHLGRRIYGCDDCLTSCPPGAGALAKSSGTSLDLEFTSLLQLSDESLVDRFDWFYIPMRQGRHLRRNILIAAGNSGEPEARDIIEAHLTHRSSTVRGAAAWSLARGFGRDSRSELAAALKTETAPDVRDELMLALLMIDHPSEYEVVLSLDEEARRSTAVRGFGMLSGHNGRQAVILVTETTERSWVADGLDIVTLDESGPADGLEDVIAVYDPERLLERLRRRAMSDLSLDGVHGGLSQSLG